MKYSLELYQNQFHLCNITVETGTRDEAIKTGNKHAIRHTGYNPDNSLIIWIEGDSTEKRYDIWDLLPYDTLTVYC